MNGSEQLLMLVVHFKNGDRELYPWHHPHTSSEVLLAWLGMGLIKSIDIVWLD